MPSGPKKRRAAKRKKEKTAISESQSSPNSNSEPSPKEVEDENEEVFGTPRSEPENSSSESESVYYSIGVKSHSRRGSSDEFKSLDFEDNSQDRLKEFKLDEVDNINLNFDDSGSRGEEFHDGREEMKEHNLSKCAYISEEASGENEQKMPFDNKNLKILPWLGEAIYTKDFITLNGSVDKASKGELRISVDENSEKVDSDMAFKNREISRDTITNVMEEKLENENSDKDFVEAIGISPVNVSDKAELWLDKEILNVESDENINPNAEPKLPTVHGGSYEDLDLSVVGKDKCMENMKLDEFLLLTDNRSLTNKDKLEIEVGQQIIENSVPFDEKTALKALVEAVEVSPPKENEVVPWFYNDIHTEYVDVNVDVEVLHPEKEIGGFDSNETLNSCQEYDISKCTSFESLGMSIQHNISNPKKLSGFIKGAELISSELENSAEESLGNENQQSILGNEDLNDIDCGKEMLPRLDVDLISNELGESIEKSSRLVDSSPLVCEEKSLHPIAIENLGELEENIIPLIESSKDSVNIFDTENPKDSAEAPEILPLTDVELISNDLGKFVEKSSGLDESSILKCEEESLNVTTHENMVEQEEDILPHIESCKDSVSIFNTEDLEDSDEAHEILPLTDVELISNDNDKSVEKNSGLDESSILKCEEEGLNVTTPENTVEQEEDILPLIESSKDSVNIYDTENFEDSAEVHDILPPTEVVLISNDIGKSVEKSSGFGESSILIYEEESLNATTIDNSVEQKEDILPLIETSKDSVNIFSTENPKDSAEVQEISLTDVVLISNDLGESIERSSRVVESSILICEEESLNVTTIENSVEQEEDILRPIGSSKNSVNPNNSAEVPEIHPLTDVELISNDLDVELISNDLGKSSEKSLGLVESPFLICEEEGFDETSIVNPVEQEEVNLLLIESSKESVNTENPNDSAEVQELQLQTDVESISNDLGKSVEKSSRLVESSTLICEEEGLNLTAIENSINQEEDTLPVTENVKDYVHTNQESHHHTYVILTRDELHKSNENSSKYVEKTACEKERLSFVNVEELNKEIHIDAADSENSVDMVQEKMSSVLLNNQLEETADRNAGSNEDDALNLEGINQNRQDYRESLNGSSNVSSQPGMKESAEFYSNSGQTENAKKNEVALKAVRPRTTIWNCCGLLETFTSSDR